jgi:phage regulator Rha-like protein
VNKKKQELYLDINKLRTEIDNLQVEIDRLRGLKNFEDVKKELPKVAEEWNKDRVELEKNRDHHNSCDVATVADEEKQKLHGEIDQLLIRIDRLQKMSNFEELKKELPDLAKEWDKDRLEVGAVMERVTILFIRTIMSCYLLYKLKAILKGHHSPPLVYERRAVL